jgi:peptidoglycan hydrolase-like protein with peptidoglycan-binding domain
MQGATIKLGSVGSDVEAWQGYLTNAGYAVPVSGVFDDATASQTKAWQAAKGLVVDGVVGPASWGAMTGTASAGKQDKHAQFGRDTLTAVWKQVTGEDPDLASLQITGATARLESNYGLSSYTNKDTGEKSGTINNWGAVQGQPGFLASDTHADGSAYTAHYRIYATPEEGAADMLKQMTLRRPTAWAHMKRGDIDATMQAMRHQDPVTKVGGYFEQDPVERAGTIDRYVRDIAFTLGEPIAAVRGGPAPEGGVASSDVQIPSPSAPSVPKIAAAVVAAGTAFVAIWRLLSGRWPW